MAALFFFHRNFLMMPFSVARTLVWSSLWLDVAASGSLPGCRGNLARAGGKIHDVSERIDFQEIGGCVIESSPVSFRKLSFVFFPSGGLKAYHIFLLCALYPLLSTAVKYVCWPMKRSARRPLCQEFPTLDPLLYFIGVFYSFAHDVAIDWLRCRGCLTIYRRCRCLIADMLIGLIVLDFPVLVSAPSRKATR